MPKRIKKGVLVLHYNNQFDNTKDKKFLIRWEGPFHVVKWYENGSYKLQDVDGKVHKDNSEWVKIKTLLFEV